MAWRCNGRSNAEMVEALRDAGLITSRRVEEAMMAVDRGDFAPNQPYRDSPQGIGYHATITAPHMHANALERLHEHLFEGAKALDVGSGSGYLTAAMAVMVGPRGKVVGIEHIPQLVEMGRRNIEKHHGHLLRSGCIELVEGDGRVGKPIDGGYNAIHVGAAAPTIPMELVRQLADGGRMVVPVGTSSEHQDFIQIDREGDQFRQRKLHGVIYVPLTSREEQLR
ncbi:hypothetical protein PFISCL1PPCAC_2347, partial [Pristionchus fissidentatus]